MFEVLRATQSAKPPSKGRRYHVAIIGAARYEHMLTNELGNPIGTLLLC